MTRCRPHHAASHLADAPNVASDAILPGSRGSRSRRRSFSSSASTRRSDCSSSPGAGGTDDRWQLHDAGLHGSAVSALAGDEDVVAVVGRADADRLQAAVGADQSASWSSSRSSATPPRGLKHPERRPATAGCGAAARRRSALSRPAVGRVAAAVVVAMRPSLASVASPGAGPIPDLGHARMACQHGRGRARDRRTPRWLTLTQFARPLEHRRGYDERPRRGRSDDATSGQPRIEAGYRRARVR